MLLANETAATATAEPNGHTYLGLGLIATVLLVIWLVRRMRA